MESLRAPANLPVRARSGHPWTSLDYTLSIRWVDAGPFPRLHPHEIGSSVRKAARACRATRFQPLRNKSSEENLPEGINVGVGSPRVFCPPSRIPRGERVKLPLPPRATLIARPWNAMYSQGIFSSGFTRLTSARSCSANLLKWTREIAREGRTKKKKKKKNWEIMGGRKRAERQREREWKRRMANVRERAKE